MFGCGKEKVRAQVTAKRQEMYRRLTQGGVLFCPVFSVCPSAVIHQDTASMQFSLHLNKEKADNREACEESHKEVLIH